MLILLDPGVQFKAIERDALGADRDLRELRPYLGIEPIAVHAEVERRVAKADEAGEKRRIVLHAPPARGAAVLQVLHVDHDGVVNALVGRPCRVRPVCPLATITGMVKRHGEAYPMENNSRAKSSVSSLTSLLPR